jgi:disulfide bond formation protein DsbB
VTGDVILALEVLGVAGQVLVVAIACVPALRRALWGYELWAAFFVAAIATGGSLFFSEVAHFVPCELCWFQRICMYPLSAAMLLAALWNDHRATRYLLPLPIVGAGVAVYHMLIERGVVHQAQECLASAPGGCATRWIDKFGYETIPTLALTGFALLTVFLALGARSPVEVAYAER